VKMEPFSKDQINKVIAAHLAQSHPATAGGSDH